MCSKVICILALAIVLFNGNSAQGKVDRGVNGILDPILNPTTTMRPNLITAIQCTPPPLNGLIGVDPCVCDCLFEHGAKNGICNKNGQCICYYPEETNVTAALPLVTAQCDFIAKQCYSEANPIAKAVFEIGCNIDCMCTHGAPAGGTCDFDKHACRCDYTNIEKAEANNSGCPNLFKDQVAFLLKGILEQAAACVLGTLYRPLEVPNPSCDNLLTYAVIAPALGATSCFSGANITYFKDSLTPTLQALLPIINV